MSDHDSSHDESLHRQQFCRFVALTVAIFAMLAGAAMTQRLLIGGVSGVVTFGVAMVAVPRLVDYFDISIAERFGRDDR